MVRARCAGQRVPKSTRRLATCAPSSCCWGIRRWIARLDVWVLCRRILSLSLRLLKSDSSTREIRHRHAARQFSRSLPTHNLTLIALIVCGQAGQSRSPAPQVLKRFPKDSHCTRTGLFLTTILLATACDGSGVCRPEYTPDRRIR